MNKFEDFGIEKSLLNAVFSTGYAQPTVVQEKVIPLAMQGRDIIACAPTGTGKTAAFLIPTIDFIVKNPRKTVGGKVRAIILSPTTELAFQTRDFALKLSDLLGFKITTIVGKSGISAQLQELRAGTDIVIATPGRAADLVQRGELNINAAEICVIDETDRMTDMGFIADLTRVVKNLDKNCQMMFFSATISKLSARIAGNASRTPSVVDVKKAISNNANVKIPESIDINLLFVDKDKKRKTLMFLLKDELKGQKVMVFTDSKSSCEALSKEISQKGIDNACLHSDKTLTQRNYITEKFSKGGVKILLATDIAARGLDFADLDAVIMFNIPSSTTLFVHRVGRTGRMGKAGKAFCLCGAVERHKWNQIMNEAECKTEVFSYFPFHSDKIENMGFEEARQYAKKDQRVHKNKYAANDEEE